MATRRAKPRSARQNTATSPRSRRRDFVRTNWLARLDQRVARIRTAPSWIAFGSYLFEFARYPRLQPASDSAGPSIVPGSLTSTSDLAKRAFERHISEWEAKIASHPIAKRAIDQLPPDLRRQLAALVHDTIANFEFYDSHNRNLKKSRTLSLEADRRRRVIGRRVQRARAALVALREYASRLDHSIGEPYARGALACLEHLDRLGEAQPTRFWRELYSGLLESNGSHPAPENPASDNTEKMYWFFKHGCQLATNEAEVRTALIRNVFWHDWIDPLKYVAEYADGESMGCDAVRKVVERSDAQGTP